MTVFFDLVRVYCTTLGTAGPLVLGGAVTFSGGAKAFRSFADAGIPDGAVLSWAIEDLSLPGREAGTGTYSASAGTLTRNTTSSTNANSPLNLSGQAQLYVAALAADLTDAGNFSTGAVAVTYGGTGAASFTAHAVLLGEGSSAFGLAASGTAGQLLLDQGSGNDPSFNAMSGDATITGGGAITVAKTNGVAFAASATTDATNAANIASGALPLARFGSISASLFLGGPTSGSASPAFRFISAVDLPTIAGDVSIPGGTGNSTVNKVNGVSYGAAPSTNTVPVVTSSNTVTYETCPVAAGGTGAATLSAHGVLIGEGTAAVNVAATGTAGQLLIDQGSGSDPSFNAMSGDATIAKAGAITVTKTNGAAFAASATTDATNAANIASGTLPSGRLSGSYTGITGVGTLAAGTWQATTVAVAYGGTGDTGTAWSQTTPTPTPAGGSFTATAAVRVKTLGKTVFVGVTVNISSAGTGTGAVSVPLPFTQNAFASAVLVGRDDGITGKALIGVIGGGAGYTTITFYDASTAIAAGAVLALSGVCETA